MYGNNGTHNAVLIGTCLLLLKSKPSVAGILAGILIYKPHMAVLFPFFFLSGGHYKALKSFILSSLMLVILSVFCFGIEPWQAFVKMLQNVGEGKYVKYASVDTIISIPHAVFSAFGNAWTALLVQSVISVFLLLALIWISYRGKATEDHRSLIFIISILLFTPYCQIYDLAILDLAILWYLKILWTVRKNLSGKEVVFIGLLWLLPFFQITLAMTFISYTGVSFPLAVILLLYFYVVVLDEILKVR
jgi:hypothetical protein